MDSGPDEYLSGIHGTFECCQLGKELISEFMFKPLAMRPGIQCQMTKHCQFLSQANAYNFFIVLKSSKKFVQKYLILARLVRIIFLERRMEFIFSQFTGLQFFYRSQKLEKICEFFEIND